MTKLMMTIHDTATGEISEREMNAEEIKDYDDRMKNIASQQKEIEQKLAQRSVLLAKLGITDDEAKLLLS